MKTYKSSVIISLIYFIVTAISIGSTIICLSGKNFCSPLILATPLLLMPLAILRLNTAMPCVTLELLLTPS